MSFEKLYHPEGLNSYESLHQAIHTVKRAQLSKYLRNEEDEPRSVKMKRMKSEMNDHIKAADYF